MSDETAELKCYTLRTVDPNSDEKNALVWCVLDEHHALVLLEQLTMAVTRKTGVFEFQIGGKLEENLDDEPALTKPLPRDEQGCTCKSTTPGYHGILCALRGRERDR